MARMCATAGVTADRAALSVCREVQNKLSRLVHVGYLLVCGKGLSGALRVRLVLAQHR